MKPRSLGLSLLVVFLGCTSTLQQQRVMHPSGGSRLLRGEDCNYHWVTPEFPKTVRAYGLSGEQVARVEQAMAFWPGCFTWGTPGDDPDIRVLEWDNIAASSALPALSGCTIHHVAVFLRPDARVVTIGHEFGHAIGLGHDPEPESLMHYTIRSNMEPLPSPEDLEFAEQVCQGGGVP